VDTPDAMKVDELTRTGNRLGLSKQPAVSARRGVQPLRAGRENELTQQLVCAPARRSERAGRLATREDSCRNGGAGKHEYEQDERLWAPHSPPHGAIILASSPVDPASRRLIHRMHRVLWKC
jgi:hypothetical protein